MKYNPRDESSIKAVMAKANVVINLIGMMLLPQIYCEKMLPAIALCCKWPANRKGV